MRSKKVKLSSTVMKKMQGAILTTMIKKKFQIVVKKSALIVGELELGLKFVKRTDYISYTNKHSVIFSYLKKKDKFIEYTLSSELF